MISPWLKAYMAAEKTRLSSPEHVAAVILAEMICRPTQKSLDTTVKPCILEFQI